MDLEGFRRAFPALERYTWLNTATAPPAATPVAEALRRVQREWETGDFHWHGWEADAFATRRLLAALVGGEAESVALMPSVAEAAATVAGSLPRGRVVVGEREFRSNLFPWLSLRDRRFEVVEVPADAEGVVPTEDLVEAMTDDCVLVAVSEVQSSTGFRVRLGRIVERAETVGARIFVDACQSLGALRLDVRDTPVDFLAVHGYKWLLAPRGAAWLHVRPDRVEELQPLAPSWRSVEDPYEEYYGGPMNFAKDARKMDASLAWFSWPGARAALELLGAMDPRAVEERALSLAAAFRDEARRRGFAAVREEAPSQIVAVAVDDPEQLQDRLRANRVVAAVRGGYLRLGFHGFNDRSDVDAALDALGYR